MGVLGGPISDEGELFAQGTFQQIAGDGSEAHLGPAEVLENGDLPTGLPTDATDVNEECRMFLVRPVRKVEPEHVDAGVDEFAQDRRLAGRRADRRHDLRPNRRQGIGTRAGHDSSPLRVTVPVRSPPRSAPGPPRAPNSPTRCRTTI